MQKILVALCVVLLLSTTVCAATISFSWYANSEPDLAGYRLWMSETSGGPYTLVEEFGPTETAGKWM
jgi:hypothetical protein